MVLIAAVPIQRAATPVPKGPYVRGEWTIVGDPGALLAIRLTPPGGKPFNIDLRKVDISDSAGALKLGCEWPGVSAAGHVEVFGFSAAGSAAVIGSDGTPSTDRTYVLWITEPIHGDGWRVGVFYANRSDSARNGTPQVNLISTLETSEGQIVPKTDPTPLSFGEYKEFGSFSIPEYGADSSASCPRP
ncbi:hypothetical protein [Mesorhizobium sp.]|uniref:hypothetical protein n=1 Tax=Mesorhizobium sp. TaxID=1871066 RepID=UPI000FE89163|nr:hypothetical protein [Mesorhizobium sp.]RWB26416.1 MAG: hypothetical protein EOQ43_30845 [Mesorhizobium sp.]